ncbi:MAG: MBL fold metallo-hydrolase [Chloroflexota bacterium]|nr:MBL fold metallo-hydrolase [Chloroflexota bacterium]
MDITWLGHSCFRIKGKGATIITDPCDETSGYRLGKITADIVTVSHKHPRHSFIDSVGGNPKVITNPGEYEIAGIFIYGSRTFRDDEKGAKRGKNTTYLIEIDDMKVCHLGDLGHILTAKQLDEVNDADVLLVPVGGVSTLDATAAMEMVNLIDPKIVIPMHYKTDASAAELEPVDKFLKEMGVKEVSPMPKLTINKSSLPLDTQVIVLDYKQ